MNGSKLILGIVVFGVAAQAWLFSMAMQTRSASGSPSSSRTSASGFTKVLSPVGATPGEVLIVGPNCTSEQGVRTRELARKLADLKVPYQQTDSARFSANPITGWGDWAQINQLMQGDSPVVFINGRAKANPSLEEVLAEAGTPVPN